MNKRMLSIGQASKLLGVTIQTLRNWDKRDLLKPDELTKGGERRYKLESLRRINYYKKGLTKLLNLILDNQVKRLVLTHKDRLLRFGAELVFSICEAKEVEVVIINKGDENVRFEEELAKDVLEIITVFSARLYGSRSKKNKKLLDEMQEVITNNVSYLNHA
ncbi:MerR family DNA-binding transcriptional regulator [Helicobacter pylori]|uniref:MerR family DNA-binding transcriptional regulator n=1 Tax=Helicobacter pylori TaxID=210 RepID=UPI000BEA5A78|nr:MerR family DNA-binding transcriptional regulator [Helicobacter pylori]PDX27458.1 hypothetical protein BB458_07600 [Helicobacter pylori]